MRAFAGFLGAALFFLPSAGLCAEVRTQVMIVGGFHMSNPGRDMHNVYVDDVLAPARQAQIKAVTDALAAFRPTVVAAEWDADTAAQRYADYRAGKLPPSRNEVVQLGFRLAATAGLSTVHGIDVEGDFPYDAVATYAKAHGQSAVLEAADAQIGAFVSDLNDRLKNGTIGGALRYLNDPGLIAHGNDFYRSTLHVGGGTAQPGAELLTAWYHRNFLICANLVQLARPGDRIVVFYGSGHALLLRQCVSETPGFVLAEPNDYLPK
ncbi:MAG TPA: DUF5694 domain-containing protein [Rhizomicrobium sp.]|nr:DUF5694 domain-containing protein [Rhizomicrobium sp.]